MKQFIWRWLVSLGISMVAGAEAFGWPHGWLVIAWAVAVVALVLSGWVTP